MIALTHYYHSDNESAGSYIMEIESKQNCLLQIRQACVLHYHRTSASEDKGANDDLNGDQAYASSRLTDSLVFGGRLVW